MGFLEDMLIVFCCEMVWVPLMDESDSHRVRLREEVKTLCSMVGLQQPCISQQDSSGSDRVLN